MAAQYAMPYPLERMLEHLDIDIERSFELRPEKMANAIIVCRQCKMFHTCDYDVESRYFICPNRDLLDQLEDLLDENRSAV